MLKVLERERIPVPAWARSSAAYTRAGYTPAEMERLIATIDWADLFVDDPPRRDLPMRRKDSDFRYLLDLEIGYANGRVSLPVGLVQGQKLLQDFLGGFLNLSGFEDRALIGNHTALYRRTGNTSRLFSLPMYIGASLETGNAWAASESVDTNDLIFAGSVFTGFDTPLGPMFLAYGRNDANEASWYLTFGSLLRPSVK